jgi:hypothetical protein
MNLGKSAGAVFHGKLTISGQSVDVVFDKMAVFGADRLGHVYAKIRLGLLFRPNRRVFLINSPTLQASDRKWALWGTFIVWKLCL